MTLPDRSDNEPKSLLPAEVEVYINPDGSVTFADLEADMVSIARKLNPDWSAPGGSGAAGDPTHDSE